MNWTFTIEGRGGEAGVVRAEQPGERGHELLQEGRGEGLARVFGGQGPPARHEAVLLQQAVAGGGAQGVQVQGGRQLGQGRRRQARHVDGLGEALVPAVGVEGEGLRVHHVLLPLQLGQDPQLLVHRLRRVHGRLPALHSPPPRRLALGGQGGHDRRIAHGGSRRDDGAAALGSRAGDPRRCLE